MTICYPWTFSSRLRATRRSSPRVKVQSIRSEDVFYMLKGSPAATPVFPYCGVAYCKLGSVFSYLYNIFKNNDIKEYLSGTEFLKISKADCVMGKWSSWKEKKKPWKEKKKPAHYNHISTVSTVPLSWAFRTRLKVRI